MPECLGVYSLSAYLRGQGCDVSVVDGYIRRYGPRRMALEVVSTGCAVVALQLMSPWTSDVVRATVAELRRAGFRGIIGLGGSYASLDAAYLISEWSELDFVVVGEAERPLAAFLRSGDLAQAVPGIVTRHQPFAPPPERVQSLDSLPFADRPFARLLCRYQIPLSISYSRGCYRRCEFCAVAAVSQLEPSLAWRARSAVHVVDEIQSLHEQFGADQFVFVDDNFVGPRRQDKDELQRFCDEIERRALRITFAIETHPTDVRQPLFRRLCDAGLGFVAIGFESGSNAQLRRQHKATTVEANRRAVQVLHELRVPSYLNTILIEDRSTFEDVRETLDLLCSTAVDHTFNLIGHAEARVGTQMSYRLAAEGNWDPSDRRRPHYRFREPRLGQLATVLLRSTAELYTTTQDLWRLLWFEWRANQRLGTTAHVTPDSPIRTLVRLKNEFTEGIVRDLVERFEASSQALDEQAVIDEAVRGVHSFRAEFRRKADLATVYVRYLYGLAGLSLPRLAPSRSSFSPVVDERQLAPVVGGVESAS